MPPLTLSDRTKAKGVGLLAIPRGSIILFAWALMWQTPEHHLPTAEIWAFFKPQGRRGSSLIWISAIGNTKESAPSFIDLKSMWQAKAFPTIDWVWTSDNQSDLPWQEFCSCCWVHLRIAKSLKSIYLEGEELPRNRDKRSFLMWTLQADPYHPCLCTQSIRLYSHYIVSLGFKGEMIKNNQ